MKAETKNILLFKFFLVALAVTFALATKDNIKVHNVVSLINNLPRLSWLLLLKYWWIILIATVTYWIGKLVATGEQIQEEKRMKEKESEIQAPR